MYKHEGEAQVGSKPRRARARAHRPVLRLGELLVAALRVMVDAMTSRFLTFLISRLLTASVCKRLELRVVTRRPQVYPASEIRLVSFGRWSALLSFRFVYWV